MEECGFQCFACTKNGARANIKKERVLLNPKEMLAMRATTDMRLSLEVVAMFPEYFTYHISLVTVE